MTTHAFLPPETVHAGAFYTCRKCGLKVTNPDRAVPETCEEYQAIRTAAAVAFDSSAYSVGGRA